MAGIKIPGADAIDTIAPTRDPGVRASAEGFGANIGAAEERQGNAIIATGSADLNVAAGLTHFSDALGSLSAHIYQKLQKATADTWVQTHDINSAVGYQQAQYDNRAAFPKGDADGGTSAQDDLRTRLQKAATDATQRTTGQLGAPTSDAMGRVNATMAGRAVDAMTQQTAFGHNEQIIGKQTVLNDNVTLFGSQVRSGAMSLPDAMTAIDKQAEAGRPLYSDSQLVAVKDKWQRSVANEAVLNRYNSGDKAGGDAIRDKYFGAIPKASGAAVDLPGDVGAKIDAEAITQGVDPMLARKFAQIESSGDQRAQTGKYKGIFQLSDEGFAAHGGTGDIFNADQNIKAGIHSIKADSDAFQAKYGRAPSATELYLSHQQGQGGLASQLANPGAPAWQNMASTAEGRQKGDAWAKLAIWGNIPDSQKAKFGSVDKVTGQQFMDLWKQKVEGNGDTKIASADSPAALLPDTAMAQQLEQRSVAISSDIKQAAAKKAADIEAVSATEQLNVFKDMHSASPTMTADDILNNAKLTPAAAQQMAAMKMAPKNNGEGYGNGYVDLYQRVHLPVGDPNRISDPSKIYPLAAAGGPLTPAGADKLTGVLNERKSLEGQSREMMKSEFLKGVKDHITGQDLGIGVKDPKGEQLYANYMVAFDKAYQDGIANNKTPAELLSGDGPMFKLSENYRRNQADWYSQLISDSKTTAPVVGAKTTPSFDITTIKSLDDLKGAAKRGDVTNAQANQYAVGMGWARGGPAATAARAAVPMSN